MLFVRRANSVYYIQETLRKTSSSCLQSPWISSSLFFCSDISLKKSKAAPLQETRMRDRFTLYAKGGDGGSGCCSIRRSRHNRRGKPDGGNGGRGGDVILECSNAVWDFRGLKNHINAGKGCNGAPKNMIGTRGEDKVLNVPVGTVIHLKSGELPSIVESDSTRDSDPFDDAHPLDPDASESNRHSVSKNLSAIDRVELSNSTGCTVAHLKCGELPSIVESCSTGDLDPLDGQHPLDPDTSESNQQFVSKNLSTIDGGGPVKKTANTQAVSDGVEHIEYNVAELTKPGQRIIVARGGEGGLGNVASQNVSRKAKLIKVEARKEDHLSLSAGLPGSKAVLILELKSIADVGLVGMPNAGKSTLLGALARAKPRVGHYAFTTLRPNLGKLFLSERLFVTVADIPGLIKGAHENRGLGHAFLRHIERTKVLAYVVDLAAALDGRNGLPPWEQLKDLVTELEHHQKGLSNRPSLVVANKIDEVGAEEVFEELKRRVQDVPIYPVCAVLAEGVPKLRFGLQNLFDNIENSHRLSLAKIDCS